MFHVKVEGLVLEMFLYIMLNFKVFGYNIWQRFNDMF